MGGGMDNRNIPKAIIGDTITLPRTVAAAKSPYPTVVIVLKQ